MSYLVYLRPQNTYLESYNVLIIKLRVKYKKKCEYRILGKMKKILFK